MATTDTRYVAASSAECERTGDSPANRDDDPTCHEAEGHRQIATEFDPAVGHRELIVIEHGEHVGLKAGVEHGTHGADDEGDRKSHPRRFDVKEDGHR